MLDTHVWVWWVSGHDALSGAHAATIRSHEDTGIGISAISCLEVAMLFARRRLAASMPPLEWMERALRYPGVRLVRLTPPIAADSAALAGEFHRDPADRVLVATARVLSCTLVSADDKILRYPHVRSIGPTAR